MTQEQYQQTVAQWEELQKVCKVCGQSRPLADFPANKQMADGFRNECKLCTKKFIFEWRQRNIKRLRERDLEYSRRPEVRAKVDIRNKEWRQNNPDRRKAHYEFHRALDAGLIKPQPCWVCGEKAEAHHADYSAPLDVVWLCRPHHKQAHALIQGHDK